MNIYPIKALLITIIGGLLLSQTVLHARQDRELTIVDGKITIKEALSDVERQTGLSIAYNESRIGADRIISLNLSGVSLDEAMSKILEGTGLSWRLQGEYVIISEGGESEKPRSIRGRIVDETGQPMVGVGVVIKDRPGVGAVTDMDGHFTLEAATGDILEISYLGYKTLTVQVTGSDVYNHTLTPDSSILDEVVVTALGIKRSEKALTYNVQEVKGEELQTVKSTNFMNALAGKAAGVQINSSASGPGGAVKVVMRGAKSIASNNNALYVIDGVPMYNPVTTGGDGSMAVQPGSEAVADINPDDIESISLLTGPSAAALYGYEGANGVVLITTKKGQAGKVSVSFSNNTTFSDPMMMPRFQDTYASSSTDKLKWNEKNTNPYNPAGFFNTGSTVTNTLALSAGNERNQAYASVSATNADGILPNNSYNRYNFTFRNTTSFLNDRFLLDVTANYIIQNDRNMVSQGQYYNPLPALYLFPRGEDFSDISVFERYDESREISVQYWPYESAVGMDSQNPYWTMYRMNRENRKHRYKISASLQYKITDWLNVQGRASIDNSDNLFTQKNHASTITFAGSKGRYREETRVDRQTYADIIANFNKTWGDFSVAVNFGGSIKDIRMELSSMEGDLYHVTNFFTIENMVGSGYFKVNKDGLARQTQSVFANAEIGWRNFLFVNATVRSDWDSALAFSSYGKKPFTYPSVGISGLIHEMVRMPSWFTFLKARFSYTSVGNSYDPYMTKLRYVYDPQNQQYAAQKIYPNYDLKPEKTRSFEAGLNLKFLDNTLSLDFTYYRSNTFNQTFEAPLSAGSGYDAVYVQAGNIRNSGIEAALGYDNIWGDFGWSSSVTVSHNRNEIINLADGIANPVTGDAISMPYVDKGYLGSTNSPLVRLVKGGSMGDLYIHRDWKRDGNGYIYLDKNGLPSMVDTEYRKVGSIFPDANLGWRNSFTWKGLKLNVLLTARIGGNVVSNTQAYMDFHGVSDYSARLRETGGININGTMVSAYDFLQIVGAGGGEGDYYMYDAANVRLQELSLEYTIHRKYLKNVCDLTLGFVANNLWMIYCRAPFDPELVPSASSTFYTGVDMFMTPSLRNFGFNVKINF